ncbi:MAG: hypothetical protein COU11_00130 [Candidatus Harrisonbacteria bacterium CG10_big_fil_rev_8_21_14_0_10_49_15]|uniref:Uncharacterized protein n=1 Tax=Candidatus Harrisonbacteria bacterium CG10_big_fil_rev_8_21_14_0_10_49_15 TaxID=1974587 RepID=A0A2H0UM67_9BACT|nr:MAG: hypothetical protein COU11_00130 [Candidatus Harrisonbacteria bacterium CG10_big_fil_rev_8_21_14_0_10_49_15]
MFDLSVSPEKASRWIDIGMPIALGLALVVFLVLGIILAYHWKRYSAAPLMSWKFIALYYIIGGALLLMMLGAYLTFTL